jgi:hypothetical protein
MNTNREQTHLVSGDFYYVTEVLLYQQLDFTTFHYAHAISPRPKMAMEQM